MDEDMDEDGEGTVSVPDTTIPLSVASLQQLVCCMQAIDPLEDSDDYGETLYIYTVRLVYQLMSNI